MKTKLLIPFVLSVLFLLSAAGCKTALTSDKRITFHQRVFGIVVETTETAGTTPTPNVKLGFVSTSIEMVPTATNQLYEADHFDTFSIDQAAVDPFAWSEAETSGGGYVSTMASITNSGGSAVIPKSAPPAKKK